MRLQKPNTLSIEFNLISSEFGVSLEEFALLFTHSVAHSLARSVHFCLVQYKSVHGKFIFRSVNFLIKCVYERRIILRQLFYDDFWATSSATIDRD